MGLYPPSGAGWGKVKHMSTPVPMSETGRKQFETVMNILIENLNKLKITKFNINKVLTGWNIYIDTAHRDVDMLIQVIDKMLTSVDLTFWQLKYKDPSVKEPYNYFDIGIEAGKVYETVRDIVKQTVKPDMYVRFKFSNIVIELVNYSESNSDIQHSNGLRILLQYISKMIDKVKYLSTIYVNNSNMYQINLELAEPSDMLRQLVEEYKRRNLLPRDPNTMTDTQVFMYVYNMYHELVQIEYRCPKCGFTIKGVTTHPEVFRFPTCPICGMADFDDTYEGDEHDNLDEILGDEGDCNDC